MMIDRRTRFYKRAVALVYRGVVAQTVQVGIVLDGAASADYESAFAKHRLSSKMELDSEPLEAVPLPAWVTQAADPADAEALRKAITEAQGRVTSVQERLNRAETQEARQEARAELEDAEATIMRRPGSRQKRRCGSSRYSSIRVPSEGAEGG